MCKHMGKEVHEKRRAFVASPRDFAPAVWAGATTPYPKISTAQYFYHSWDSKMKYLRICAMWDFRSRFEFAR